MLPRAFVSPPLSPLPLSLKVLRVLLALSLALTTLCAGLLCTTYAQAATPQHLDNVLGPLHIRVQWNLQDHEQDYIGTPYVDWTAADGDLDKDEGPWWSQGIPSPTGAVGMNDAGFIAHVIMQTGYSMNSFSTMNAWFDNNAGAGTAKRTGRWANVDTLFDILKAKAIYKTFSSKEELLKSDYLQKCDIIIMKCDGTDQGGTDDFGRHYGCAHKSHVGIFYGEDSDDDVLWHSNDSYYGFRADELLTGNNLSRIQPSCWGSTYYVFKWQELGRVFLWRTPTNTELVRNNSSYSFYDCWHYTSYKSDMSTHSGVFPTHNITTDEQRYLAPSPVSGCAMPGVPTVGEMWMQGYTPGKGYVLDDTIYYANVKRYNKGADQVTNVYSLVKPKYNPLSEVVSVYDADRKPSGNAGALPSGNAKLQGAQFRVRFYAGQFETYDDIKHRTPTRNWIFQTDPAGKVTLTSDTSTFTVTEPNGLKQSLNYQLSGNALFTHTDGSPILSLGTYLITPYKASEGYQFEDENAYSLQQINDESYDVEVVDVFEAPTFTQSVIRGGVHISVEDADYVDKNHLSNLGGAQYEIRNDSAEAVVVDGRTYQPDETVATITTNDIGYAATDTQALPYGTYSIKQTKAYSGGALKDTTWTRFEISTDSELANPYVRAAVPTPVYGGLRVTVTDAQTGENTPQGDGSFEDIAFEITNASESAITINDTVYEPGALIDTIRTNASGIAETSTTALARGTYTITAKNAPLGYSLSHSEPHTFTIEEAEVLVDPFVDEPFAVEILRGGITIERRDADNNTTTPQGDAALSGATYAITNASTQSVWVNETLCNPGDVVTTITIDNGGASTFADTLPYGTYTIGEATPSEGYYQSNEQKTFSIRESGQMHAEFTGASAFRANVIKGAITGTVLDTETQSAQPLGSACIAGAQFNILNASTYPVWVEGRPVNNGEVCTTLNTDYNGVFQSSPDYLPAGTYELQLISAPRGFEPPVLSRLSFAITTDGYTSLTDQVGSAVNLSVVRSDITLSKTSAEGPLASIPYRITSKTTGESHIIVTDENGIASTAASHTPHSQNTNGNDNAAADSYDPQAGVWFGAFSNGVTAPNDNRGALPFDTYIVEELPCPANEGCDLDYIDNVQIADHSTPELSLTHPEATITKLPSTQVYPSNGSSTGVLPYTPEQGEIQVSVDYEGLIPGQSYTITIYPQITTIAEDGTLNTSALCDPSGNPIVVTQSFTPETESGTLSVTIPTYGADLSQTALVFFDELASNEDPSVPLVSHKDPSALPGVIVSASPLISTRVSESLTGAKTLWCAPAITLTDVVSYFNLTPGVTYEISTSAFVKNPDTGDIQAFMDENGNAITTAKTFTPEASQGTLTTSLTLNTTSLAGFEIVVCETLTVDGVEIAASNDLQNPAQTLAVVAPSIQGATTDASDHNHTLSPFAFTTLSDSIAYNGLIPGNEYTLQATVMVKSTDPSSGDEDAVVVLLQDGKPVQTEVTFTPEATQGTLDLSFTLSTESLAGYTLVIYEDLLSGGETIATSHNPENPEQTLTIAARTFRSIARDAFDKDSALSVGSAQKACITTEYRGLVPGESYTMLALAMDAATGLPYQNALSATNYTESVAACWNDLTAALHIQTDTDSLTQFTGTLESYYGDTPSLAWNQESFVAEASEGAISCEVPVTTTQAPQSQLAFYVYIFHNAHHLLTSFESTSDTELTLSIEKPLLQCSYVDGYDSDRRLVAEEQRSLSCDLNWQSLEPAEDYTLATVALEAASNLPIDSVESLRQRSGRSFAAHKGSRAAWNLITSTTPDDEAPTQCTLSDLQAALNAQGEPSSQAWMFTPLSITEATNSQMATVSFNATSLEGKQIKFASYLFNAQGSLCTQDTAAWEALPVFDVLAPSITTKAETPSEDGKTFTMSNNTTFTDTVSFNNLGTQLPYTLLTILIDRNTGLPARTLTSPEDAVEVQEPLDWSLLTDLRNLAETSATDTQLTQARAVTSALNAQAKTTVCFESTFTPETESGFVKPEFTLDTVGLQNDAFVIYEYVFGPDGSLRISHADLQDNGSALYLTRPLLTAESVDASDGDHVIRPEADTKVTNTVTFRGLEPSVTYEAVGVIVDKNNGSPLVIDNIVQETSVSFTPESTDGTITLSFTVNAASLGEQDLVVFNTLYRDGKVVATQRDLANGHQSLLVRKTGSALPPAVDDPTVGDNPSDNPNNPGSSDDNNQGNNGSDNKPNNPSGNQSGNPTGNQPGNTSGNQSGNASGNPSGNSGNSGNSGSSSTPDPDNPSKNPNAFLSATIRDTNGSPSSSPDEPTPQDRPASSQDQSDSGGYKTGYYAKTGRNLTILLIAFGLCSAGCAAAFIVGMRSLRKGRIHQD